MGHQAQVREAGRRSPVAAAPPPEPVDVVSRLRDLKGLLDSGALTPQEFDAAKQKLLSTT